MPQLNADAHERNALKRDAYPIEPEVTDPKLDAMLDEALSPFEIPGGIPNDLTERLVSATAGRLPGQSPRGVVARIGSFTGVERLGGVGRVAAVLALVASIVGAFVVWSNMGDGGPEVPTIATSDRPLDKSLDGVLEDCQTRGRLVLPRNYKQMSGGQWVAEMTASVRQARSDNTGYMWSEAVDHAFHASNFERVAAKLGGLFIEGRLSGGRSAVPIVRTRHVKVNQPQKRVAEWMFN